MPSLCRYMHRRNRTHTKSLLADAYSYTILVGGIAVTGEVSLLPVKHGILGILAERPRHGYELKTEFDLLTGGLWELNVGQIYSTLERMLKDGLVVLEVETGGAEDRKVYRITAEGRGELAAWLDRPPLRARPVRDEVYVRLGLLLERNLSAALALIESQRRIYHVQMAELTREKLRIVRESGYERFRKELLLDAALLHTEADLKWLDTCEDKLQARLNP